MTKLGFLRLSYEKQDTLLKLLILSMAAVLSFSTRLFSVLRFESVIHEFDPYFNYRTTRFLAEEGFYKFHNWFDDRAWYPLGRIIGGTIYPGLMITSAVLYHVLHFFHITIDIRNVCVFLAPLFSSFTAIVTYHFTKELKDAGAGLLAAAMIAVVPGYISRSVAGSYDNEGIAIFCMLLTYYMWIKAVKSGSVYWSSMCALAYFYMVKMLRSETKTLSWMFWRRPTRQSTGWLGYTRYHEHLTHLSTFSDPVFVCFSLQILTIILVQQPNSAQFNFKWIRLVNCNHYNL
uniref:Dolichyl-diphosphooligosaccharide--protein glycosyltransferase subunit STT3A n=1 Tax=Sphaeramia orbicularis TaxID=375764 RepID=A0A672YL49_9TELE